MKNLSDTRGLPAAVRHNCSARAGAVTVSFCNRIERMPIRRSIFMRCSSVKSVCIIPWKRGRLCVMFCFQKIFMSRLGRRANSRKNGLTSIIIWKKKEISFKEKCEAKAMTKPFAKKGLFELIRWRYHGRTRPSSR